MIKLHGFAVSNFYNMVKFALLEKAMDFEEVHTGPSQENDFKAKSPMGKIPFIETEQGYCSESIAIMEYLEQLQPNPALVPSDPYKALKMRELIRILELYIELPARRHYGEIFFGGERNQAAFDEAKPVIENGLSAVKQLANFDSYLCGDFSQADIVAAHSFIYVAPVCQAIYEWDVISEVPGLQATLDRINDRDAGKKVMEGQAAALKAMEEGAG